MAQPANTFDRYDLGTGAADNVREQFANMIYNLDPTETPFQANIGIAKAARNTLQSWQTDEYADPVTTNAMIEGDAFTAEALSKATRLSNIIQTLKKDLEVSDIAQIVNTAGRKNELSYQTVKKSMELKRDLEAILLHPQIPAVGAADAARKTATVLAWVKTNLNSGANGTAPTLVSGTPGALGAQGTGRPLKMGTFLQVITEIYEETGPINAVFVHPRLKSGMSGFLLSSDDARIAKPYFDVAAKGAPTGMIRGTDAPRGIKVVGAVSQYMSDFSIVDIIPDRFQQNDDGVAANDGNGAVYMLKTDLWALSWMRRFRNVKMSKNADTDRRRIVGDVCLISRNEKANGAIVGLQDREAVVK